MNERRLQMPDAALERDSRERAFMERYRLFFAPEVAKINRKQEKIPEMSEHENSPENRRQELERQVAERTAQLDAANKELEAFNYSVSHDLRAPLRVIAAFSEKLLAGEGCTLDATGRHNVERVVASARRMGELIEDMLKLSQAGSAGMERAPVNLSELAAAVAKGLAKPEDGVRVTIAPNVVARGEPRGCCGLCSRTCWATCVEICGQAGAGGVWSLACSPARGAGVFCAGQRGRGSIRRTRSDCSGRFSWVSWRRTGFSGDGHRAGDGATDHSSARWPGVGGEPGGGKERRFILRCQRVNRDRNIEHPTPNAQYRRGKDNNEATKERSWETLNFEPL